MIISGRAPFDHFDGRPRVSHGPNIHLALSALTVWAARGHTDADLRRMATETADLVSGQMQLAGDGSVPYGPGGQRFPGGVPFQIVFNPEYQIDAYALLHRMARSRVSAGGTQWPPGHSTGWSRIGTTARRGRFWSTGDKQQKGYPLDTSGWALSMVGPAELAKRGVDVTAMVADLGQIPGGVVVTEWLVNRLNGPLRRESTSKRRGSGEDAAEARGRGRTAQTNSHQSAVAADGQGRWPRLRL